jgi:galactokinase
LLCDLRDDEVQFGRRLVAASDAGLPHTCRSPRAIRFRVVAAVQEEHALAGGLDVEISTTLPIGGGLSSSASFELALAQALFAHAGIEANADRLAAVGRRAEREFVGIHSGAMDQLAVAQA